MVSKKNLECSYTALSVICRNELLGNNRLKNACKLDSDLLLLVRREYVDNTVDGGRSTDGMEG